MKLECKLIRDKGTRVELDGVEYHFEPLADGAHVAEVEHKDHIDRLLGIPEAYRLYHGDLEPTEKPGKVAAAAGLATAPVKKEREGSFLKGSSNFNPQYTIGGTVYPLADVTRKAFEASGLTEDDWNELPEDEIEAKIEIVLDDLADAADKAAAAEKAKEAGEPAGDADPAANAAKPDAERDALVEQYKTKFGKAPHYRASAETIKAALAAE